MWNKKTGLSCLFRFHKLIFPTATQICRIMERLSISATVRCTNSMAQQPGSIGQTKRPQTTALVCSKDNRKRLESQNSRGTTYRGGGAAMSRKQYPHLPNHKLETVSRYLLGESCEQMQMHRALDDAKLAAMIWLEMGKAWADCKDERAVKITD